MSFNTKRLAQDLRKEAAGALDYVQPRPTIAPPPSAADIAVRKVLRQSDLGISADAALLSPRVVVDGSSDKMSLMLGSAGRVRGYDTYASVRSPYSRIGLDDPLTAPLPSEVPRGHRVDLRYSARVNYLSSSAHELASHSRRGFERGCVVAFFLAPQSSE